MKITRFIILGLISFIALAPITQAMNNPILAVNELLVSNITSTTADVSVPSPILTTLTQDQKDGLYFEYIPTKQVCIMIYPTPENCLPKKTMKGQTSLTITDLKPNTSYTISYKKDNGIACITTPCPENGLQSLSVEFTTPQIGMGLVHFSRNLKFGSRGNDVVMLQNVLRNYGYFLNDKSTGYFGITTFKAVKAFQKNYMKISPTGYVGPKTRAFLNNPKDIPVNTEEFFSGTIQSVSTGCFSDGECSVTIDGKKVVTTIGWSQAVVGSIKGTVSSIGEIETNKIGARAKVYAKKTTDGYTLYGNSAYYIEVF
jgi:peptidoglycan hydrolase-like protein with peptidoglycan-binding domain